MAVTCGAYWAGKIPAASFTYSLPFGIEGLDEDGIFLSDMGVEDILRKEYAKFNVHLLGFQPQCATYIMSTKPVRTVDDWKGMKVRTIGLMADAVAAAGASVAPIPTQEVYIALETGVVDAASWASVAMMRNLGFHEVTDYLLYPPISGVTASDMFVNMDRWNELPDDLKEIINLAEQAYTPLFSEWAVLESDRAARALLDAGELKASSMSPEEQTKMMKVSLQKMEEIASKDPVATQVFNIYTDYLRLLGKLE
jgi:TRAP-type mannitol/chloroaromatic compound transport system substrate-binding protein